jgi:nitroreductase
MIDNPTLTAIRERRSVRNFTSAPVPDQHLEAVLEAGRWAPSRHNSQPWDFVVVRDPQIRSGIASILRSVTWAWAGIASAPTLIVVSVDPSQDPGHFVEDGAVAAQNLCLAAQSLGLASSWAGVYSSKGARKRTAEHSLRTLLSLPQSHRIIAVVPIGQAGRHVQATRRPLEEMVHYDGYQPQPDSRRPVDTPPRADHDDGSHDLPKTTLRRPLTEPARFR